MPVLTINILYHEKNLMRYVELRSFQETCSHTCYTHQPTNKNPFGGGSLVVVLRSHASSKSQHFLYNHVYLFSLSF